MTKQMERLTFTQHVLDNLPESEKHRASAIITEFLALARKAERYNDLACTSGLTDRQDRAQDKVDERFLALCAELGWRGKTIGDPRGYAHKICFPNGAYNSWGGPESGYGVPS